MPTRPDWTSVEGRSRPDDPSYPVPCHPFAPARPRLDCHRHRIFADVVTALPRRRRLDTPITRDSPKTRCSRCALRLKPLQRQLQKLLIQRIKPTTCAKYSRSLIVVASVDCCTVVFCGFSLLGALDETHVAIIFTL